MTSIKQHCDLRENEQFQQADLCKCQTVTFIFKHNFPYSFKHLSQLSTNLWMPDEKNDVAGWLLVEWPGHALIPNVCRWSHKTLVSIHWVDLSVNSISDNCFWTQKKRITDRCYLQDTFDGNVAISVGNDLKSFDFKSWFQITIVIFWFWFKITWK